MVDGYRVLNADGTTREGGGAAAAQTWLTELTELIRSGDGYRLLYGDPDVAALVHNDGVTQLTDAARIGALVPATASLPLLILPGNGTADEETVQAAAALDPAAILLSDATIRTTADSPVLEGPDGATLVRYTAGASGGGPGPAPRNTPAKVQQRMLSDTWIAARSAPAGSPAGRVRLITDPNQTAGTDNEVTAPWLAAATLTQLLTATPLAWSGEYRYTENARGRGAHRGSARRRAAELDEQYDTYADLLVEPKTALAEAAIALPRSVSLSWRDDATASQRYTSAVEEYLNDDPVRQDLDQRHAEAEHHRPLGDVPHHGQERPSPGHGPRHERDQGQGRVQLVGQPAPDRGAAGDRPGRRRRPDRDHRRPGAGGDQRQRQGARPAADVERDAGRPRQGGGDHGHPGRHHRLADRHRRRDRAGRHHGAAHPPGRQGARPPRSTSRSHSRSRDPPTRPRPERPPRTPSMSESGPGSGRSVSAADPADPAPPVDRSAARSADASATSDRQARSRLISSGAVMAAGTAVSRVLGFGRFVLLVILFGNGTRQADMFTLANTVPNSMYILLAGGVLNTVLVPQIVRAVKKDADRRRGLHQPDHDAGV